MQQPPWPPPQGAHASLNPPSNAQRAQQGTPWYRDQVYYPTPWFPKGENIGLQLRRRPLTVLNGAINTASINVLQFDIPTTIYGLSAAAVDTGGAALPVGLDSLDSFTVQFRHTNGDNYDTAAMLGSASLGPAENLTLLGGTGWMQDRGSSVEITITPLRATMRIDVCLWGIEVRGPANYTWPGR